MHVGGEKVFLIVYSIGSWIDCDLELGEMK